MSCKRGGGGNVGTTRCRPFIYELVATFFDAVPLEVQKEMLLESKEVEGRPYHLDSEVMGENLKWVLDPSLSQKKQLHFLNSLASH